MCWTGRKRTAFAKSSLDKTLMACQMPARPSAPASPQQPPRLVWSRDVPPYPVHRSGGGLLHPLTSDQTPLNTREPGEVSLVTAFYGSAMGLGLRVRQDFSLLLLMVGGVVSPG